MIRCQAMACLTTQDLSGNDLLDYETCLTFCCRVGDEHERHEGREACRSRHPSCGSVYLSGESIESPV
jgi:hypothetical protein